MTASGPTIFRGVIIVAICAAILLVFLGPGRIGQSPVQPSGKTYGRILVDSPEIYTRERMVNDRFRQEAWLLEQLEKLTGEKPGIQGVVAGQSSSRRDASLSLGTKAGAAEAAAGADPQQAEAAAGQPQLTPIESFRVQQSVREEVRNALIENQLDDRHDLGGNTLYRLKFDATIIPGNDTSAWAQIKVHFKRNVISEAEEELELKELFERWMSDLREQVNTTYSEEVLKATAADSANFRVYDAMLYNRVGSYTRLEWKGMLAREDGECWDLLLGGDANIYVEPRDDDILLLQEYSPDRFECLKDVITRQLACNLDACRQQLIREDVMGKVVDVYGTTLGQKEGLRKALRKPRGSTADLYGYNQRLDTAPRLNSQQFVSFLPAADSNSILVEEYTAKIFAVPDQLDDSERDRYNAQSRKSYAVPLQLGDSEREMYQASSNEPRSDAEILDFWTSEIGCSETVPVRVAGRTYKVCKWSLDNLQSSNGEDTGGDGPPAIDVNMENDYDGFPFFYAKTSDDKILETWTAAMNCTATAPIRVAQREFRICDSWIEELREIATAAGPEQGPLSIDGKVESDFDGFPMILVKVGYSKFRLKLKKSESNKFLFSYAVTPRESSQQLASSSRMAVAEQIRAGALGGADGAAIEAGAGRSSLFSEYAQILERRPVIVGIASHPDESSLGSKDGRSAELGWLIGPRLTVGPDGRATYRHLPSQNSLSALVSAPSWWRRADIEIETGWLDDQGELIGVPVQVSYAIALPGDQEEITSALLLGGKRPAPSVESVEPDLVRVGEEASLLIEGQNLWRSTVVTIGAQRSKKIFVLPNMKGIIAEFDPIEAQETRPPVGGTKSAVRVWTSEGVAPWKDGIEVKAAVAK